MINKIKERDSNFELLRIVSMFFIILYHMALFGGYTVSNVVSVWDFILTFFASGGKLGVILFVMITGYYKIKDKDVKISRLVELELQVLFYSLGIFLFFVLLGNREFVLGEFSKVLFPNISKTYWFFSSYFILYLFIPFVNKFVHNLDKKEYKKFLVLGFIFLILVPSIVIYNKEITQGLYLFYYYLVGGYIRLYLDDIKGGLKFLGGFIVMYLFIVFVTMYMGRLAFSNALLYEFVFNFSRLGSVLLFLCSICLFMFFKGLKIKNNKIINLCASVSFGVYLFHDHIFMRDFLWRGIFSLDKLSNGGMFLVNSLFVMVLVYVVGGIIEFLRQAMVKYFMRLKSFVK